jgi:hypothetical protein
LERPRQRLLGTHEEQNKQLPGYDTTTRHARLVGLEATELLDVIRGSAADEGLGLRHDFRFDSEKLTSSNKQAERQDSSWPPWL